MKRYKKKELLEFVKALERENDILSNGKKAGLHHAEEILVQCQEVAISIGTYIDTLEEKYGYLVKILEDYCENIYQMNERLSDENLCRKLSKKIRKQLLQLEHAIYYDLPEDKKEIVFLPYKVSMWDSLESVWKAADQDETCDAFVIPIPYYDKNPDGSLGEIHYEGELYPENVPIIRYEDYDFANRSPDMIFIHNPYDGCNQVTSVHPFFYAKNLKQFTEKLVYIPYFILEEINPEDKGAAEGVKNFCILPGVIHADKVVVQSEDMRQVYINIMTEEMGGTEEIRQYWEQKILGTGSPKVDKVRNARREDYI